MPSLQESLLEAILLARKRVYALGSPTPLEAYRRREGFELLLKREDLSPIHAYKWRGAYNAMAALGAEGLAPGVVTASAGNHAQGVALAARELGCRARIYMPKSTPQMKQSEVARFGGDRTEILLVGDTYDEALEAARLDREANGSVFVHAYNDLAVMGGQGTIADEIVMSGRGPFDVAYLQIGGGGMAAAVGFWLKKYFPDIRLVGVEGEHQASMRAAFEAGKPVRLDYVDVFCDGTAVRQAGDTTYAVCRDILDELITVTNDEVSAAMREIWEMARCVPEPSGAMGLAGALREASTLQGKRVLAILCGANMDFHQLGNIAREADVGAHRLRYFRISIPEGPGQMLALLNRFPEQVNIAEFQYGKRHAEAAWPVVGFEAPPAELDDLARRLREAGVAFDEVTHDPQVEFRVIPFHGGLVRHPVFITVEFHERPGALAGFLSAIGPEASICYFNYSYSGERVGRALMGFEFAAESGRHAFRRRLADASGKTIRAFREIAPQSVERML